MTRRERRYLFIINVMALQMHHLIRDTNEHIEQLEATANERLSELLQKQIEADTKVLECWENNVETLLTENERIAAEQDRLRSKLKVKRRLMRELE